ncbi:MAG TPA: fluoride efflux transporter CrcB [Cyclobacteriaceae bacterium]|nr:fluoride efflux transporter CrcB [Cyclobacteriaceae bacterium]
MKHVLLIFAGGGLGSVARYLLGRWVSGFHQINFPFGTLAVNVVACFILGVIVGFSEYKQALSPDSRVFWAIGFCGGFSTFSTFSYETVQLIHGQAIGSGVVYVLVSVVLCVGAVVMGMYLGK